MTKFAHQAVNIFNLDDDCFALLSTMSYYSEIAENNSTACRIKDPKALENLSQEYRRHFIQWCDNNKAPRTFGNIQLILYKLKQLDDLYRRDIAGFLKITAKHFDRKTIFADLFLN